MKKITLLLLFFIGQLTQAQIIKDFPTDKDGLIHYDSIVKADGVLKDELFLRAKHFFVNSFKSANSVIQMEDKESGIMIGKGMSSGVINAGMGVTAPLKMYYTIKIQSKDSRYRYEIYNIYYSSVYGDVPIEGYFLTENYYKKNGKPKNIQKQYFDFSFTTLKGLENNIIESMVNKNISSSKENW